MPSFSLEKWENLTRYLLTSLWGYSMMIQMVFKMDDNSEGYLAWFSHVWGENNQTFGTQRPDTHSTPSWLHHLLMAGGRGEKKDCDRTAAGYRQQGWLKTSGRCCCDGAARGGGNPPRQQKWKKRAGSHRKAALGFFPPAVETQSISA